MLYLRVILVFLATVQGSVIFQDCGSAYELEDVEINGCDMRQPCYITLGEHVPVNIYFVADFKSVELEQDVVININYLNLETEVTPELCDNDMCPVDTDCITSLTSVMTVPRNMALNQRGWLRWRVYNEQRKLVLCYAVLIQTQSPLQKALRRLTAASSLFKRINGTMPINNIPVKTQS